MKLRVVLALAGSVLLLTALPAQEADRTLFRERTSIHGQGKSMLPTLPAACVLALVRVPFAEIKVGLLDGDVISTRINGRNVLHRAVARRPDGSIVTWGDNNPQPDAVITTERNYIAVIIGYEDPARPGEVQRLASRAPRESHPSFASNDSPSSATAPTAKML